jgi:hypothetical protein
VKSLLPLVMEHSRLALPFVLAAACFAGPPPVTTPPALDTVCPANVNSLITANPWAFQLRTGAVSTPTITLEPRPRDRDLRIDINPRNTAIPGVAAIGTFVATGPGVISATLTTSDAGVITRRATTGGRYILYPDCSGGEIMIMINTFAVQLEFVWANNFRHMLFVSDSLKPRFGGVAVLTGSALPAPAACPASVAGNPLNLLNGTQWQYRLSQQYLYAPGDASIGSFKPFVSNGAGFLTATETSNTTTGFVTRLAPESGRYQVYPDCSGGEIMLMNRAPGSVQLEYVFAGSNFEQMFLLNDNAPDPADVALGGTAYRY